jgi:hypothetical protein
MKLTIYYENQKLSLDLNSPIKTLELVNQLSRKINRPNIKLSLLNPNNDSCFDEHEFIVITEDVELMLVEVTNYKPVKIQEKKESFEETLKYCTDAIENIVKPIITNKKSSLSSQTPLIVI